MRKTFFIMEKDADGSRSLPSVRGFMSRMEKRIAVISWMLFFFVLTVICVLSFQSGNATKALEKPFVESVTGTVEQQLSREMVLTITFYIRQAGRAVLFLILGFCGGCGLSLSFRRWNGRGRSVSACLMLFGISYFTEKMKIFIDGRHYAFAECLESFIFAALGYFCAVLFLFLLGRKKRKGAVSGG